MLPQYATSIYIYVHYQSMKSLLMLFQFDTQLSYTPMNLAPCQRGVRMGCALNTVQFAAVSGSKRDPCERWQGALFIGVLT